MDKKEKKLSWNKEYYYEDGTWWFVDGKWKDEEVDCLPSIRCEKCAYAGEDENGGDGIESIYRKQEGYTLTEMYKCAKCGQLHLEQMKGIDGDYGTGYYDLWNSDSKPAWDATILAPAMCKKCEYDSDKNHVKYLGSYRDYYKCVKCGYDWTSFYDGSTIRIIEGNYI